MPIMFPGLELMVSIGVVWRSLQAKIPEYIKKSNPKKESNEINN